MSSLLDIRDVDKRFYEERLQDFLPKRFIDFHTHVWTQEHNERDATSASRTVSWTRLVADENPVEDLLETNRLLFPDKDTSALIFGTVTKAETLDSMNAYVAQGARSHNLPALVFSDPTWSAKRFEEEIRKGGFLGAKSYLSLAPSYIPPDEIRIFDFFPHHQLEVLDKFGWILMLHIPRSGRFRDPVNLAQLLEIEEKYPNLKMIVAHIGRAYANDDAGDAFEILKDTTRMRFDFCANTNDWIFEQAIKTFGPKRLLYGSDLPILRMRCRRVIENGTYINIVPKGLYGDVSGDAHMREATGAEADSITFFLYEEIDAFRRAAEKTGLGRHDIEDIFHGNSRDLLASTGWSPST